MAKQTPAQKKAIEKTMRAFKDGELESSAGGAVKNPKQAIAIALSEAGASRKDAAQGGGAGQTTRRRAEGPSPRALPEHVGHVEPPGAAGTLGSPPPEPHPPRLRTRRGVPPVHQAVPQRAHRPRVWHEMTRKWQPPPSPGAGRLSTLGYCTGRPPATPARPQPKESR